MVKMLRAVQASPLDQTHWQEMAEHVLQRAKNQGATAAEVSCSIAQGYSVTARLGDVETLEHNRDKGLGVTVYFGQRRGSASTTDLSPESLQATLDAACNIAKYTESDAFAGLADLELMAVDYPDLALYFPWELPVPDALAIAKECEQIAMQQDKRIHNSEGATLSTHCNYHVYANSHGFVGGYASSRHSVSCVMVAEQDGAMERDYYYSVARDAQDLQSVTAIAKRAAERTVRRLGAKTIKTQTVPVIFEAEVAKDIFGLCLSAIRGSNLYRRSSFLVDHLGKTIFPEYISLLESPHLPKGLGSAAFDSEGVATQQKYIVQDGVLKSYVLGSYSARKLAMQTTGNAGGNYNIEINTSTKDLAALLKEMQRGVLVTEVMGQGVNLVTGDYSRGAAGFWVEHGEIQYPIHEFTIASNLKDMFQGIVCVGNDINVNSSLRTGSVLLREMTIAGA